MLAIEKLSVWYGPTEVLRNVSFSIESGSIVALLGGNGAGKTTLLKALSGLLRPTRGSVMFNGRTVSGLDPRDIVIAGIAQVPQGRFVWPSMSVRDNLELGAITRNDRAGIEADIERVCSIFPRMKEKINRAAGSMSGGEQQMLTVARTLMGNPLLLMLDEPSEGVAPVIVEQMAHMIMTLKQQGLAILLSEQNLHFAQLVCDRAYVLEQGQIRFSGTMQALAANEDVQQNYLSL